jgi:hypothetical protein
MRRDSPVRNDSVGMGGPDAIKRSLPPNESVRPLANFSVPQKWDSRAQPFGQEMDAQLVRISNPGGTLGEGILGLVEWTRR